MSAADICHFSHTRTHTQSLEHIYYYLFRLRQIKTKVCCCVLYFFSLVNKQFIFAFSNAHIWHRSQYSIWICFVMCPKSPWFSSFQLNGCCWKEFFVRSVWYCLRFNYAFVFFVIFFFFVDYYENERYAMSKRNDDCNRNKHSLRFGVFHISRKIMMLWLVCRESVDTCCIFAPSTTNCVRLWFPLSTGRIAFNCFSMRHIKRYTALKIESQILLDKYKGLSSRLCHLLAVTMSQDIKIEIENIKYTYIANYQNRF